MMCIKDVTHFHTLSPSIPRSLTFASFFVHAYHHVHTFCCRENEKRKKTEEQLESEWDDLGSAITEVFNMPVGQDDDDVDLDSMVV